MHVQPKPWRKFRFKGKKKNKSAKDRFIPVLAKLVSGACWFAGKRVGRRSILHELARLAVRNFSSNLQLAGGTNRRYRNTLGKLSPNEWSLDHDSSCLARAESNLTIRPAINLTGEIFRVVASA